MEIDLLPPPPPPPHPVLVQMNPEVHTAQVATAPPPKPSNLLNHPPYAKMIVTAIKSLNEKKGSSRKAIAKFIDSTYSNLPQSHSALLTHHLKRLKKNGIVLMVKHSYKLPKSPSTSTTITSNSDLHPNNEKRGRGRPPKPKPLLLSNPPDGLPLLKRGPGRPPKANSKPNPKPKTKTKTIAKPNNLTGLEKGRRPRGRPRKDISAGAAASVSASGAPSMAIVVPPSVPGKRGRPRGPPKVRGPPPMKLKRVSTGKPVGRPKKAKIDSGVGVGVGGVFVVGNDGGGGGELEVVVSGGIKRGRGRPPKKVGGVVVMKPKKVSTGRPVGRPRKMSVEGTTITPTITTTTTTTDVNVNVSGNGNGNVNGN